MICPVGSHHPPSAFKRLLHVEILHSPLHPPLVTHIAGALQTMSPIALAKIPLLLLATAGLHIAVTPPQPPPDETEKAAASRVVRLEAMLKTRSVPATVKVSSGHFSYLDDSDASLQTLVWIACICEILAILAATIPQLDASSNLVSLLSATGSPTQQCTSGINISLTFVVCGLMAAVGGFIRWCCYRALGRMFTFEMSIRQDHRLVTNGPYAYARHPGYTAILLTVTGIAGMHATEVSQSGKKVI